MTDHPVAERAKPIHEQPDPATIDPAKTDPEHADRGGHDLHHHGDVEARGAQLDFAVNVVPGQPAFLREVLHAEVENVAAYPDEQPARLALAAHLGVDPRSVLLVNGAAEAFTLIARVRQWRRPLVVHPQFTEPEAALLAAGRTPARLVLRESDGFALTPEDVAALIAGESDLVVVGNPTNPTSRLHDPALLRRWAGSLKGGERVTVVDEAFMDVVAEPSRSLVPEAARTQGLLVLRSLTKTFALAGIRAGYVVGHPDLVAELRAIQPPWSVNSLALAATRASATEQADRYVRQVVGLLEQWRPHLVAGLTARGWEVVAQSRAPFVLARHPDAERLRLALREKGIAVRRGDTFPGLDPTWARFALRPAQPTDALLAALDTLSDTVGGAH